MRDYLVFALCFISATPTTASPSGGSSVAISWRDQPYNQTATLGRGDSVVLDWAGTTSVMEVATKDEQDNCMGGNGTNRAGIRSPTTITIPDTDMDGTVHYYLSTVGTQCTNGKILTLTVSGGAPLNTVGMCVDVACRKITQYNVDNDIGVSLDPECCGLMGVPNYYEELSCAEGYQYYQTTKNVRGETCDLGGASTQYSKGTCCVKDGSAAPADAVLPDGSTPAPAPSSASKLTSIGLLWPIAALLFAWR